MPRRAAASTAPAALTMMKTTMVVTTMVVTMMPLLCRAAASPRVLVTDGLAAAALQALQAGGVTVTQQHFSPADLGAGALADFDGVLIRSATTLTAAAIDAGCTGKLRLIGRAGVGVDNIDVEAAVARGLWVVNTPAASTASVAELTLAHLLNAARGVTASDRGLRKGLWLKPPAEGSRVGCELMGKRLGLLGFGRIAQRVATCATAFGMDVHATSPRGSADAAEALGVTLLPSADALFEACTHVSVHCSLTPETSRLVGARLIEAMPRVGADGSECGRHLVNMARGGIVDEAQVADALTSGELTSYSADVFESEPLGAHSPLLECDGFTGTPHTGGVTAEAQQRVGLQLVVSVLDVLVRQQVPADGIVTRPADSQLTA